MRKRIISQTEQHSQPVDRNWLDLVNLTEVELTSEDVAHPIESALLPGLGPGWRAAEPGTQTIRLIFACPQPIHRIQLQFTESQFERTQEYVLRWSSDGGRVFREIVRQHWNFSPQGATGETEEHHVDLPDVDVLELTIVPDINGEHAIASMARLRVA